MLLQAVVTSRWLGLSIEPQLWRHDPWSQTACSNTLWRRSDARSLVFLTLSPGSPFSYPNFTSCKLQNMHSPDWHRSQRVFCDRPEEIGLGSDLEPAMESSCKSHMQVCVCLPPSEAPSVIIFLSKRKCSCRIIRWSSLPSTDPHTPKGKKCIQIKSNGLVQCRDTSIISGRYKANVLVLINIHR